MVVGVDEGGGNQPVFPVYDLAAAIAHDDLFGRVEIGDDPVAHANAVVLQTAAARAVQNLSRAKNRAHIGSPSIHIVLFLHPSAPLKAAVCPA
ncbi:hypothetical protein SDC9_194419 [bioreactor metagenome]|uniref:Uncharacterized protein n=1 Tax=bioreactor metagenome TaxID=1076179 RepID=A0A645I6U6_9ZZZZ